MASGLTVNEQGVWWCNAFTASLSTSWKQRTVETTYLLLVIRNERLNERLAVVQPVSRVCGGAARLRPLCPPAGSRGRDW